MNRKDKIYRIKNILATHKLPEKMAAKILGMEEGKLRDFLSGTDKTLTISGVKINNLETYLKHVKEWRHV